jgi:DNA gyrase/topoisomerase IV subunit B
VDEGRLLWLIPPLYGITLKSGEIRYAIDDTELTELIQNLAPGSYTQRRYKGLGEMNDEEMRIMMGPLFNDYAFVLHRDPQIGATYDELFSQRKDLVSSRKERILSLVNEQVRREAAAHETTGKADTRTKKGQGK